MPVQITKKQPTATVSQEHKSKGQTYASEETQEPVGPPKETGPEMANVGFQAAFTRNLGNYESLRVSVDLHMPCPPDQVDQTFEQVKQWVDDRMNAVIAEMDDGGEG